MFVVHRLRAADEDDLEVVVTVRSGHRRRGFVEASDVEEVEGRRPDRGRVNELHPTLLRRSRRPIFQR